MISKPRMGLQRQAPGEQPPPIVRQGNGGAQQGVFRGSLTNGREIATAGAVEPVAPTLECIRGQLGRLFVGPVEQALPVDVYA
ncbi:MAG TPA: hypothetical protein VNU24_07275, partial [Solirubrobacteraceae bacterium]|nr:hypothetical protein [Solirubrobacteraceae bacterium]